MAIGAAATPPEIDLERFLFCGLGDLSLDAVRALRCPTCGQKGPAEIRIQGPIREHIAARAKRDAEEREVKVVRLEPKR